MALITEMPRYPELRTAMAALQPNLMNASSIIATHQARGALSPGDPLRLLTSLIAPLITAGMWARAIPTMPGPHLTPGHVVDGFLNGHGRGDRQAE